MIPTLGTTVYLNREDVTRYHSVISSTTPVEDAIRGVIESMNKTQGNLLIIGFEESIEGITWKTVGIYDEIVAEGYKTFLYTEPYKLINN